MLRVRKLPILLCALVLASCGQSDLPAKPRTGISNSQPKAPIKSAPADANKEEYIPPTAEEMAPMRPEYLAELAKIHEPPEMANKPMQVRKAASTKVSLLGNVLNAIGRPEKASHEQRQSAIQSLLATLNSAEQNDGIDKQMFSGAAAAIACIDGSDAKTTIGYLVNSADSDSLALRSRMYLKLGDRQEALDDLQQLMTNGEGRALAGGDVDPRKGSNPCGWSLEDFDSFGDDPRALAARALYLSAFIGFGAEDRGTIQESAIRELYVRSASSWHSPIPHVLQNTVDGFGSAHSMTGMKCIRAVGNSYLETKAAKACAAYDEETRREIRNLTMALVIEPSFRPALTKRAEQYLRLAQGYYADGNPSRQFFNLAIKDFNAALASNGEDQHALYCDRALALASVGKYLEAASGYELGMKYAKNGVEDSPFVYEQLANLYMKLGRFSDAADLLTQAIMNTSGGGMDAVIFMGGMKAFRVLYAEYDSLPDEILAEDVRRRYQPQFPQTWDAEFISKPGTFDGKLTSSVLADLYVMRGDAYMKAGRRAEGLADYHRIKSDAWSGTEPYLPRQIYFNERGLRNWEAPEPWPPPAPTM